LPQHIQDACNAFWTDEIKAPFEEEAE